MLRMTPKSCKYTKYSKYPGLRPRKGVYLWPTSLFLTPRPRKWPFFWPPAVHFRSHPQKQPFSWTANLFVMIRPRKRHEMWPTRQIHGTWPQNGLRCGRNQIVSNVQSRITILPSIGTTISPRVFCDARYLRYSP